MAVIQTNIDKFRLESKLRLKDMAPMLGMTMNNLQKVKNDDKIKLSVIYQISQIVGCYPSELLPDEWQKPCPCESIDTEHEVE